jgi:hypothetical protein
MQTSGDQRREIAKVCQSWGSFQTDALQVRRTIRSASAWSEFAASSSALRKRGKWKSMSVRQTLEG